LAAPKDPPTALGDSAVLVLTSDKDEEYLVWNTDIELSHTRSVHMQHSITRVVCQRARLEIITSDLTLLSDLMMIRPCVVCMGSACQLIFRPHV